METSSNKGMKLTGALPRSRAMARTAPAAYPRCSTDLRRVATRAGRSENRPMNLLVELPDEQADELRRLAERLGIALEQLARAALADLAGKQAADFETAADRVLAKNAELYRRLA